MKIVILDGYTANIGEETWKELERLGTLTVYDRTPADKTVERSCDAEVILTNKVRIHQAEMEQLPRLKYIGVLATGYNVVDVEEACRRGIVVTNIPAYSTDSVAQMVFAHLLTVTNRVEHYAWKNSRGAWTESPDFCYWDTPLTELAGKVMGIVGLGNIGQKVAAIAQAFGMQVMAVTSKQPHLLPQGVKKVPMEELLKTSDVVSLHCPLTADTCRLINRQTLAMMKPTAILINTGRGPLIDEEAVAQALQDNRLQAFCADVLAEEPPREDHPLLRCPHAYITPHIAWATKEARTRLVNIAIANVKAFLQGRPQNQIPPAFQEATK
jgi:glycerate dehydrogenase